jgi:osmoprotectant transport system substrate-binding protein
LDSSVPTSISAWLLPKPSVARPLLKADLLPSTTPAPEAKENGIGAEPGFLQLEEQRDRVGRPNAGTALQFLSLGRVSATSDVAATHDALVRTLGHGHVTALAPAPAQDANAFVVTRQAAVRNWLRTLSDLAAVASRLTFGGPPECPSRALCLVGLQRVYGLTFKDLVRLDAGGPVTRQALRDGHVDVALLFTTDPAITAGGFVELADDRGLQPAENVTPLVRTEVVDRGGPALVRLVDAVSRQLTTDGLRSLNAQVADGRDVTVVAKNWLKAEGLP